MSEFFDSIVGKILRWILFFPLGLVVILVVKLLIYAVRYDSWSKYMIEYIPTHCLANGGAFCAAVITVYIVVPHFKMKVAIIFALLFGLFYLASIILPFFLSDSLNLEYISFLPSNGDMGQISVIGYLSSIVGSIIGIAQCDDFSTT